MSAGSVALLMGWGISTNGYPSAPSTPAISSAAEMNFSVMMLTDGMPFRSPVTLSCKLLDEQLPQSPTPATNACQVFARSMISAVAGAL